MASTSSSQDVSNCVSAPFDPVDGNSPGSWSLCYNGVQNSLTMSSKINSSENPLAPPPNLVSTIDEQGLNDLIAFLYQVKMMMQKQKSN